MKIPDVFAERPILICGKWKKPLQGSLTLDGIIGINLGYTRKLEFSNYIPTENNKALSYLWARQKLQLLSDYSSASNDTVNKKEIIELGLKYNLLTMYTSFVAVDSIKRNEGGAMTTVVVPNPMPQGVSDKAIGNYGGGAFTAMTFNEASTTKVTGSSKIQFAYPNPFINQITLLIYLDKTDLNKEKMIEIYNSSGQKIQMINISELNHASNSYQLTAKDIGHLSQGIYLIQLRMDGIVSGTCKIVKK